MPSNNTYVCFTCRRGFKQTLKCPSCGRTMESVGHRISIPKKNNLRAWKRMESGELRWNRKKFWKNGYTPWMKDSWVTLPGHKKGQPSAYQGTSDRFDRPDMPGK